MNSTSKSNKLTITATICTRDRPELLTRALKSLIEQSRPADSIIVIDNAPSNNQTREIICNHFSNVEYFREELPGLDFARNKAIEVTRTDVIAFLDDDAVADKDWVKNYLQAFEENNLIGACTGRVEPLSVNTESQRLFEANGGFSRGLEPITLPPLASVRLHGLPAPDIAWAVSIGNGCSMAIRIDVFQKVGLFDEALDLGGPLPGGGDLDMLWRILSSGYLLQYLPEAIAWHEHRTEMPAIVNQIVGHQRALIAFLVKTLKQTNGPSAIPVFIFLIWRLLKPGTRIIKKIVQCDPLPFSVLFLIWKNCFKGLLAYNQAIVLVQSLKKKQV